MLRKPLTIRDALVEDIELFNENKKLLTLNSADYFTKILKHKCELVNGVSKDELRIQNEKYLKLIVRTQELEKENKKVTTIEKEIEKIVYKDKELDFPAYVFRPELNLAKKINRAIALERKNGNLSGIEQKDYLQIFTTQAINYFIENEFTEI